ncbi:hypothetical protein BDF14DRAFT_1861395 [Spinellus fusiger]|nr:hypothetical protein BDF14DRAFT_1871282 [Spinellus fusiger]KAI7862003.1 hypothetical protein BDF14DRAFT_1861395 [Spinellus fusiger]
MIKNLPPVIVKVQQKIHHMCVIRAMHCCLVVLEETKILSIIVIFNIDGVPGKEFFGKK